MPIKDIFAMEHAAIIEVRKVAPKVGASVLAKKIKNSEIPAGTACFRSFYSIYSVIRRYDAKQKAKGGKLVGA